MFTGIIEAIGEITEIKDSGGHREFTVTAPFCSELKLGDSVSINGACQSVTNLTGTTFSFFTSNETLSVTTLSGFKKGDKINLERALKVTSRLDGHIVQGHVDGTATVTQVEKAHGSYHFTFKMDTQDLMKYVVNKASIAINGISLTVFKANGSYFECAIIPITYEETNLNTLKPGSKINVETDIISKYIEGLISKGSNSNQGISIDFLKEHGF